MRYLFFIICLSLFMVTSCKSLEEASKKNPELVESGPPVINKEKQAPKLKEFDPSKLKKAPVSAGGSSIPTAKE